MDADIVVNAASYAEKQQQEREAKLEAARRNIMAHWASWVAPEQSSPETRKPEEPGGQVLQQGPEHGVHEQPPPVAAAAQATDAEDTQPVADDGREGLWAMLKGNTWLLLVDGLILTNTTCLVVVGKDHAHVAVTVSE